MCKAWSNPNLDPLKVTDKNAVFKIMFERAYVLRRFDDEVPVTLEPALRLDPLAFEAGTAPAL
jgi:hypothetical protein